MSERFTVSGIISGLYKFTQLNVEKLKKENKFPQDSFPSASKTYVTY
jgi:hypothetical protein